MNLIFYTEHKFLMKSGREFTAYNRKDRNKAGIVHLMVLAYNHAFRIL